jgi:hypothetical protein
MNMARKKRTWDFEDEADVLAVLGAELDIDADDLTIDDTGRGFSSFGTDTFWYVQTSGGSKGWVVARDSDAVRELALATVKQDLETEPEIFEKSFLESHIDIDRLRRDLSHDVRKLELGLLQRDERRRSDQRATTLLARRGRIPDGARRRR